MPISKLTFIIDVLLAFVEIKSQGKAGFPFQTHPQATMVAINCLLLYGFVSIIELIVHAARFDIVYAMMARKHIQFASANLSMDWHQLILECLTYFTPNPGTTRRGFLMEAFSRRFKINQ
ncbi:hypothetical protein OSB04_029820 [Centaurea solstitialis]|uniref:Uncharacterized protein n=1 Tax=Centaurea solstitialis TaxID=347529 RepID=A0AA38SPX3_9ASTR|nr:hypothetical protein OSB04_029820 [Centaurea solstitialis]